MGNDPLLGKNTPFWSARRLRSFAVSVFTIAVGVFTFAYRGEIVGFIHDAISRESLGGSFWGLALLPSAIAFLMVVGAVATLAISITMLSASELVALAGAKAVEIAYGVKFERASIPAGSAPYGTRFTPEASPRPSRPGILAAASGRRRSRTGAAMLPKRKRG